MTGIVKSFDGQRVLHDVDFDLRAGEVHILAGENGAGKSTLIKILGGVHRPDAGQIRIRGRLLRFRSPREAAAQGVAIIHQELSLVPSMSVADNIFLGRERSVCGWADYGRQNRECADLLKRLGLRLDPRVSVASLPISLQQMIEVTKALSCKADIIVMDEPTSALERARGRAPVHVHKRSEINGCGIIYITHKLEEVYRIADRITVLRDGHHVATDTATDMPADALIRHMVGRELASYDEQQAHASPASAPVRLAFEGLTVRAAGRHRRPLVDGVSLEVHAGEIVGLGGAARFGQQRSALGAVRRAGAAG